MQKSMTWRDLAFKLFEIFKKLFIATDAKQRLKHWGVVGRSSNSI